MDLLATALEAVSEARYALDQDDGTPGHPSVVALLAEAERALTSLTITQPGTVKP